MSDAMEDDQTNLNPFDGPASDGVPPARGSSRRSTRLPRAIGCLVGLSIISACGLTLGDQVNAHPEIANLTGATAPAYLEEVYRRNGGDRAKIASDLISKGFACFRTPALDKSGRFALRCHALYCKNDPLPSIYTIAITILSTSTDADDGNRSITVMADERRCSEIAKEYEIRRTNLLNKIPSYSDWMEIK